MKAEQYPEVTTLLRSFFNQDWFDAFETRGAPENEQLVITDILRRCTRAYLFDIDEELSRLLTDVNTEGDLRRIVIDEMDANIDPNIDGSTMRAWLELFHRRVKEQIKYSLK